MKLTDFLPYVFALLAAGIASYITYSLCERNFRKKLKAAQSRSDKKITEIKEDSAALQKQLTLLLRECEQITGQLADRKSESFKTSDQPVLSPIVKEMFNSVVTYITMIQGKSH
jgi:septal ring factor EnvC (AmiA/AmiB activator)